MRRTLGATRAARRPSATLGRSALGRASARAVGRASPRARDRFFDVLSRERTRAVPVSSPSEEERGRREADSERAEDATTSEGSRSRSGVDTRAFDVEYDEYGEDGADASGGEVTMASVVALIVGSTVGAGALALPASTAPAGIVPAGGALFGVWVMLVCDALLIAEVNLAMMRERDEERLIHGRGHSPVVIPLADMAERTLGERGSVIMNGIYACVSLTILVAYINKAGDLLEGVLHIDPAVSATAFTVLLGGTVCFGGTRTADSINQALTYVCLAAFTALLAAGSYYADWNDATWVGSPAAVSDAIPIIFLTLVFHDLVPVVCSYLNGDSAKIRSGILIGSLIPLAMFELWNTIALAMAGGDATKDPLDIISDDLGGAASALLGTFGVAALATSFIGCCLGISAALQPFVEDALFKFDEPEEDARMTHALFKAMEKYDAERKSGAPSVSRLLTFGGIITVPLVVAASFPNIFLPLTGFVGAYGMTIIYGVMPPLMALCMRREAQKYGQAQPANGTPLPGGEPALMALIASAVFITLDKAYDDVSSFVGAGAGASASNVADVASLLTT